MRVENRLETGTPDVLFMLRRYPRCEPTAGWIELKHEPSWPSSDSTPLVLRKLTREQVEFAEGWSASGGRSFFLLQASRDYVLFGPRVARAVFERTLTRPLVLAAALAHAPGAFPAASILKALTG